MVGVNSIAVSTPETPFGGVKESGYGSEGGLEGLQAYLNTKFISQALRSGVHARISGLSRSIDRELEPLPSGQPKATALLGDDRSAECGHDVAKAPKCIRL